jgi:hypothetical protein
LPDQSKLSWIPLKLWENEYLTTRHSSPVFFSWTIGYIKRRCYRQLDATSCLNRRHKKGKQMNMAPKQNDALGTSNRGNPCESGLCTLCASDCKGKCETWLSSLLGRKLLYPRNFGNITSGSANVSAQGIGYHALRIQGYAYGADGIDGRLSSDADDCIFPNVDIGTSFGRQVKTKCRVPIMTGALGSTFIASKYWDSFAVGAAFCGFPIVVGEFVVGID